MNSDSEAKDEGKAQPQNISTEGMKKMPTIDPGMGRPGGAILESPKKKGGLDDGYQMGQPETGYKMGPMTPIKAPPPKQRDEAKATIGSLQEVVQGIRSRVTTRNDGTLTEGERATIDHKLGRMSQECGDLKTMLNEGDPKPRER